MQNIKAKLECYLDKEMKSSFVINEGYKKRYKKECKNAVTTIVNKTYEVLIHDRCKSYYESQPDEFLRRELPPYSVIPFEELVVELFTNYTTKLFEIFETDLLDGIQGIKNEISNKFVEKILGYIHGRIISYYKIKKTEITECEMFNKTLEYVSLITSYISLIKKEINFNNDNSICYNTYLRNLEETVDEFIEELRRCVNNGSGELHTKRIRYIYFYIKENILTKFY